MTLPAWLPLLLDPGLVNTRAGGDSPFLLQRVHQMSVALRGGHFPARWMPDGAFGFGYPFWNYYAPLAYYVAAAFHLAGLGFVNAIKLTQILGILLAAAGMYALVDDIFDNQPVALLAAAAYVYTPFHLVNIYVRGDSLGELVAFAFYPLIFLGLRRLRAQPDPGPAIFTALTYAGLILTHNISALIFTPFAIAYALLLLYVSHITHHASRYLLWTAIALALGLVLSTWYWAPALLEQDAVQLEGNLTGYFHYGGHFRSIDPSTGSGQSLIQRELLFNFDLDAAGTPFAMGLIQTLLGLAGLLTIAVTSIKRHSPFTIHNPALSSVEGSQFTIRPCFFFAGTALVSTFLITPWSRPLWDHIPLLPFVQFPWRWLSVQAFGLSVIIGGLSQLRIGELKSEIRNPKPEIRWGPAVALSLLLIATSMLRLRVAYLPVRDSDVTPERLMLYEMFTGNIGSTVRAEYLPAGVVPRPWTSDALMNGRLALPIGADSARLLERGPASQQWQVAVEQQRDVVFPVYWFPGWRATIDGQPAETSAQPNHGGVRVAVPAGTHQVKLTLDRTPTRRLAELASAAGMLFLLVLFARRGLTVQDLRRGAVVVAIVIAGGLVLAGRSALAGPLDGPLTMDFSHMPYLHPNPGGIPLANGLRLLRYELSTTELEAGQTLDVELTWNKSTSAIAVELDLVSPAEVLFHVPAVVAKSETRNAALSGTILNVARPKGPKSEIPNPKSEIPNPKSQIHLHVPVATTAGLYLPRLRIVNNSEKLSVRTLNGGRSGVLYLQSIRIRPIIARARLVGRFADVAGLGPVEARLLSPERLEVAMTWWAEGLIAANYATSVRLKSGTGEIIAQVDTQPCYGFCPTSLWKPGIPVYDHRWLDLPAGTVPDEDYKLEIVLYERASLAPIDAVQLNLIDIWVNQGADRARD